MSIAVGIVLALIVGGSSTFFGLDRDRALYPVVMIVIASYYALFAVMDGSMGASSSLSRQLQLLSLASRLPASSPRYGSSL